MYYVVMCMSVLTIQVGTPQFKIGDLVRVSSDMEKVRSLQQGHGDWSNAVVLV